MTLEELLKKHFGDDADKVKAFVEDMKTNKIYTSNEENLDIRYGKLKGNYDALVTKEQEAQNLIAELKKSNGTNLQSKVTEYEATIANLEKQNAEMTIDNEIKFGLLAKGAKASDIDYLMFKIKQGDDELKLDKDGKVKGLDHIITDCQKVYTSNFEDKSKRKVDVIDLPQDNEPKDTMTKAEFLKKPYAERVQFANDNPEAFNELMKQ